jgi:hypothetical protein
MVLLVPDATKGWVLKMERVGMVVEVEDTVVDGGDDGGGDGLVAFCSI